MSSAPLFWIWKGSNSLVPVILNRNLEFCLVCQLVFKKLNLTTYVFSNPSFPLVQEKVGCHEFWDNHPLLLVQFWYIPYPSSHSWKHYNPVVSMQLPQHMTEPCPLPLVKFWTLKVINRPCWWSCVLRESYCSRWKMFW